MSVRLKRSIESAREASRRAGKTFCVVQYVGDATGEYCEISEREAKHGERAGHLIIIETVRA